MTGIKIIYLANIVVAGYIGITSLFFPRISAATVFQNAYPSAEFIRLIGCLWLAIALISVLGLWRPLSFSPVLLLQLIYKGIWLLVVALPAIKNNQVYPSGMAVFFLVWVLVLPFVIPWAAWVK
ncbi:hypothetical protein QWY85_10440 [Neolewinella lacunae]|uniref:Uncharacterized protein n=1 Tax=Neolewinella lacunae TaxID=1517758 RepID=A0A923PK17_9BACT|nr:hypothetical protein [Neolewinella lacunae]MBC6995490.1 hypothetical protein [Neolewinella lacunae]MDN3635078.1 hypothetical protein [Neolewinella lacunae]